MDMPSEATLRRDLAAAYRLAALFGWDDTIYTHFSVRLPGVAPRFLINPFGLLFEEIRASDLIVVDMEGRVLEGEADYNIAGFTIHSAMHMARGDAHCVLHTHTLAGMAVAAADNGLAQLNQISAEFHRRVGYHGYEGIALDLGERERLVASLGDNIALILRHHGLLSVGASVADAFYVMYYLNKACEIQLAAAALDGVREMPEALSQHACGQFQGCEWQRPLLWQAWLRKLDRLDPSYKD
ncbi:class II aldolase/adducin family protein [Pseudomonas sp. R-28-1W-6]|jgi:ribulose-5-phosphate 4-epimerase/fuculose-1-phosphate aldolase|uniref:class II aldolase/adducin family protein n=1 Tax=Pseudomonas sp. R-28-1W-6 TaxID=2650101 RepID=UPI001C49AA32|nr:class II aldolase/adducin family protein [Pseudomonas sp. R-28-1W-6]